MRPRWSSVRSPKAASAWSAVKCRRWPSARLQAESTRGRGESWSNAASIRSYAVLMATPGRLSSVRAQERSWRGEFLPTFSRYSNRVLNAAAFRASSGSNISPERSLGGMTADIDRPPVSSRPRRGLPPRAPGRRGRLPRPPRRVGESPRPARPRGARVRLHRDGAPEPGPCSEGFSACHGPGTRG